MNDGRIINQVHGYYIKRLLIYDKIADQTYRIAKIYIMVRIMVCVVIYNMPESKCCHKTFLKNLNCLIDLVTTTVNTEKAQSMSTVQKYQN